MLQGGSKRVQLPEEKQEVQVFKYAMDGFHLCLDGAKFHTGYHACMMALLPNSYQPINQ